MVTPVTTASLPTASPASSSSSPSNGSSLPRIFNPQQYPGFFPAFPAGTAAAASNFGIFGWIPTPILHGQNLPLNGGHFMSQEKTGTSGAAFDLHARHSPSSGSP